MEYSRRQFISVATAGMGTMLLNDCHAEPQNYDPYEIVELGKTGIKTTRLSMGTGIRAGNGQSALTRMGREQAIKLVREIYERGVRKFDMADSYGTHRFVSEALQKYPRNNYVIFTKMWPVQRGGESVNDAVESVTARFLEELKTDYIDGLQLHYTLHGDWNTVLSEYMTALDKLKQKGVIRSHGLSCHALPAVETAVNEPWVDTIHVRFNAYGVNMDDKVENVEPVVKRLHQAGKGVIAMKVMGEGEFANNDEQKDNSLSYVLRLGAVDVMTIGMDKISDIMDTEIRIRKVARG